MNDNEELLKNVDLVFPLIAATMQAEIESFIRLFDSSNADEKTQACATMLSMMSFFSWVSNEKFKVPKIPKDIAEAQLEVFIEGLREIRENAKQDNAGLH